MKKLVTFLVLLGFGFAIAIPRVKADEIVQEPEPVQEEVITEDTIADLIKDKLGVFKDTQLVVQIIGWLRDAGVLTALVGICLKYNKYKHKTVGELTTSVVDVARNEINEKIKDFKKQLEENKETIATLKTISEKLLKAFVLAQDKSPESKLAILDLLHEEPKAEEIKEEVIKHEEVKQELLEKVEKRTIF